MKQPVKKKKIKPNITTIGKVISKRKKEKPKEDLDGSGLETYFRINFLEKLGIEYIQQFKAEDIGRFYDFYLTDYQCIIEIDGSYFHQDPRMFEKANRMQKRNKRVDEVKNKWAIDNGFLLLRFWEYDIYNNPQMIIDELKRHIKIQGKKVSIVESKKNGSFFKTKK